VAVVCASACGRAPRVAAPAADQLAALRIEGNRAIATDALAPALALHDAIAIGGAIDPYVLTADAERIRAAYLKRGFFAVRVTTRIERAGGAQVAVFAVVEGRQAAARVEIAGLPAEVPLARARALVAVADGAPFDYAGFTAAKQPLAALVENAGYAHVEVRGTAIADPDAATATLRYEVHPGVRCTFGEIRVAGTLEGSLLAAVIARVRFATGDRYSVAVLEQAQAEIYELGRFSTVQIVPDRTSSAAVIDVAIELSEANRHEVHAGFGAGYEQDSSELRVRGGGSYVPAAHPLFTLASDLRVALTVLQGFDTLDLQPKIRGLVSVQRLDLFRPRLRGELAGGADYQTVEAYTWIGEHVRLGLGSPLGPRWLQLRIGWLLEHVAFDPKAVLEVAGADGRTEGERLGIEDDRAQLLGEYQASLVADLRDNPIEPRRGAYLDLRAAVGTPFALGDLTYIRLTPELRGYATIGGVTIAARARVGAILGEVAATQRFYSGGTAGQRGFPVRRLSPTVPAGCLTADAGCVVVGGAGLIEAGVELRRQIGRLWSTPVGLNVFLDGGDVTDQPRQLDPSRLYWAVGAGIWGKLVGDLKIRIDLGYRINRTALPDPHARPRGEDVQLHLGVGETY
jgi:translocation and assembly module TamA